MSIVLFPVRTISASVSPIGEHNKRFIRLAYSPDGLHWTPRPEPLMCHMSDTQTTVYYDEVLNDLLRQPSSSGVPR